MEPGEGAGTLKLDERSIQSDLHSGQPQHPAYSVILPRLEYQWQPGKTHEYCDLPLEGNSDPELSSSDTYVNRCEMALPSGRLARSHR